MAVYVLYAHMRSCAFGSAVVYVYACVLLLQSLFLALGLFLSMFLFPLVCVMLSRFLKTPRVLRLLNMLCMLLGTLMKVHVYLILLLCYDMFLILGFVIPVSDMFTYRLYNLSWYISGASYI